MSFQTMYLEAMREKAPKMFNELRRDCVLLDHAKEKGAEADRMLASLLPANPTMANRREAQEQVNAALIEFPPDEA